jgi:hypothetical protein
VAELGELAVYGTDHLDVVVLDEFQVLLLVLFRVECELACQLLMKFADVILLPVRKLEVILPPIAEQTHHLEQQLEEGEHEHTASIILQVEGVNILDRVVEVVDVLQLQRQ